MVATKGAVYGPHVAPRHEGRPDGATLRLVSLLESVLDPPALLMGQRFRCCECNSESKYAYSAVFVYSVSVCSVFFAPFGDMENPLCLQTQLRVMSNVNAITEVEIHPALLRKPKPMVV